ncbi:DUF4232 domain-containing protein [Streptomyces sp. H27-C3]|uniref:DUF4232 domain-containing protein n=1 Tax=Streptomyces sp. H27-C3 TaxID=3046305 RepID=UPI0024BA8FD0|nr:DUF4232 domain-containing protein [Streptomyces sp. H27-C3]MDJ0463971.1 DUF4232 domain-containing protein [Streptomyces sp. H27-C3]
MPTSRIRTAALAATTAALALTLAGCGVGSDRSADGGSGLQADVSSSGDADSSKGSETMESAGGEKAAEPARPSAERGTSEAGSDSGTGTVTSSDKVAAGSAGGARPCNGDEMSYAVLHRFARQQGEHLLITAHNADSKPCWVTSYPSVILGDTSNVVRHSAKDAPGGSIRITVKPGGTVYSAVNLFTDSAKSHTSVTLSLALRDRTGDTGPGTEHDAFDTKGAPTKFTWSSADVLNWNTAKPYDF